VNAMLISSARTALPLHTALANSAKLHARTSVHIPKTGIMSLPFTFFLVARCIVGANVD
jgi:hypothetical protein